MKCFSQCHWLPFYKIHETSCLFSQIDNVLKLNFNVMLLSLNNISEFKKQIFCVCFFLCTDGIGPSSSKGNAITFWYIPEIHEWLVKIKGETWRFFTVATTSTNQSGIFFHFWNEHILPFVFQLWFTHKLQWISWDCCKCNVLTFCYTPEIHEFLVKAKGLTWIFKKNPFVDIIIMVKNINVKPLTFTKFMNFRRVTKAVAWHLQQPHEIHCNLWVNQ